MTTLFRKYPQTFQGLLFLCFLAVALAAILRGTILNHREQYPVEELDAGWVITRNEEPPQQAALTDYETGSILRGEQFTLTRTLPADDSLPSGCLYFRALHAAVTVEVDGQIIYTRAMHRFEKELLVARMICFVPLPEDYAGKKLSITFTAAERDAFYGLGPILYGVEQDLFVRFIRERQIAFYVGTFLFIFGIIQLLWMPLLLRDSSSNVKLLFSSLTTLILGIYLFGYYNLFDLFTDMENANTMLEYTAFYLIACVMSGYISTIMQGRMKTLYRAFVVFDLCFLLTAYLLHFLNIVHFTRFLLVCYAISFVEATPFIVSIFRGWGRHRMDYIDHLEEYADRALVGGFICYVLGSFTDAAIFSYIRFSGGQEATVRVPFLTAGSLLYSGSICLHYFLSGVINLRAEATRQTLHDKAYSDSLTGLSNRGECDLVLEEIGRMQKRYTIISLDLDDLKPVNDTLGHTEGDRMLQGFADILKECFPSAALIGRMGGDEFIVILTGEDSSNAGLQTKRMLKLIDERNREESEFQYSVSFGAATSSDKSLGKRARDIYMLADSRMYDMKQKRHHAQRRGGASGNGVRKDGGGSR